MARPAKWSDKVLAALAATPSHGLTLEELRADIGRQGQEPEFSALFRAVEQLVAYGTVRRVAIAGRAARHELAGQHHDHLLCTACDRLVPVGCLAAKLDLAGLEHATGFALAAHDIVLPGLCPACRGAP
ncbi:MAG: transcriptional repressor [Hyphomicrobiales bacterium]|nr:transcriptional repressor [Hyphomicrobiales bacterium]